MERREREMQQWEYCAVAGLRKKGWNLEPYYPATWHFRSGGSKSEPIGAPEAANTAETIARLGQEGWEMVGCVPSGDAHGSAVLYFKRPIAE
jgi:sugar/nucleoside kinase (ribokinase family)